MRILIILFILLVFILIVYALIEFSAERTRKHEEKIKSIELETLKLKQRENKI